MSRVLAVSCVVLFWMLLRRTQGEDLSEKTKIVASKVLPVVINTWGPPFTNATAEGREGTVMKLSAGVILYSNRISLKRGLNVIFLSRDSVGLHFSSKLMIIDLGCECVHKFLADLDRYSVLSKRARVLR